jgi:hypothetical protein
MDVPGWTAPATRSPAPDRLSPAFWVVDFWESGVTGEGLVRGDGRGREGKGVLFSEACSPSPLRRASDMMIVGWWLVVGWVLEVECR